MDTHYLRNMEKYGHPLFPEKYGHSLFADAVKRTKQGHPPIEAYLAGTIKIES